MGKNAKLKVKKERIWELDFLRALCVLLMIFDHTMYNFGHMFGSAWSSTGNEFLMDLVSAAREYWVCEIRNIVQPIVVIVFCTLCGISTGFSRSNLKRGLEVGFCAMGVAIVTTLMDMRIVAGILQMFTVAILSWWLIDLICRHEKSRTAFACLAIGTMIVVINEMLMGAYRQNHQVFVDHNKFAFIGEFLYGDVFDTNFSADYQPIFPLVGYMLIGAAAGTVLYPNKKSLLPRLGKYDWYAPINFWGKIALIVYVLHQVVITSILALISFIFITPGDFVVI